MHRPIGTVTVIFAVTASRQELSALQAAGQGCRQAVAGNLYRAALRQLLAQLGQVRPGMGRLQLFGPFEPEQLVQHLLA